MLAVLQRAALRVLNASSWGLEQMQRNVMSVLLSRALTFSPVLERQVLQNAWQAEGEHDARDKSF